MPHPSFVFPPPPPPPPPHGAQPSHNSEQARVWTTSRENRDYSGENRGRARGRGGNYGNRGRGANYSRQIGNAFSHHSQQRGTLSGFEPLPEGTRLPQNQRTFQSSHNGSSNFQIAPQGFAAPHLSATQAQKRGHAEAFKPTKGHQGRTAVAPAVPSFNSSIEGLTVPKNVSGQQHTTGKRQNLLGLTPTSVDNESSSEDDEDEESKLATRLSDASRPNSLQFTYKGKLSQLSSQTDIIAWVEERKRTFPTSARRAAALVRKAQQKEDIKAKGLQRSRELERSRKESKSQPAPSKKQRDERQKHAHTQPDGSNPLDDHDTAQRRSITQKQTEDKAARARLKDEKLKKKLERAQQRIALLESSKTTSIVETENIHVSSDNFLPSSAPERLGRGGLGSRAPLCDSDAATSKDSSSLSTESTSSDEDGTSSDESSGSESDQAPIEETSKQRNTQNITIDRYEGKVMAICRDFKMRGRCKRGRGCRYRHERPGSSRKSDGKTAPSPHLNERFSLYQRLKTNQQMEDDEKLLHFIIRLGQEGRLVDSN